MEINQRGGRYSMGKKLIQIYCDTELGVNRWLDKNQHFEVVDIKLAGNEAGEIIMVIYKIEEDRKDESF